MLEIAYCLDNLSIGGTELNAVRWAEQLDRSRFNVRLVTLTPEGPLRSRFEAAGVEIHVVSIPSLFSTRTVPEGIKLGRYLKAEGIDIVHAHDSYSNLFAVPFARMAKIPAVIASRRWWHGVNYQHAVAHRVAYRFAHRVIANADRVGELLREEGVKRDRITVIPNFLEDVAFEPPSERWLLETRRELELDDEVPVIGTVARLDPIKNLSSLLRASRRLIDKGMLHTVVIVGDGPHRATLQREAAALKLEDHVRFAGTRPSQPTFHHLFDISVLTSTSEGFPNTILEAMAVGNPVVVTRVGGVPDLVEDGELGLLIPPRDDDALVDAVSRLLADADLRGRLGEAGQRRVRQEHGRDQVIGKLSHLYETLAGVVPGGEAAERSQAVATSSNPGSRDRSAVSGSD